MSLGNQEESKLEIKALGRNVSLGYLYNERTDQFYTFSIFKRDIPSSVVDHMPKPSSTIESQLCNTYKEKFQLYKIDGNTKVNILCGQLKVEGSADYLKHENESAREVTGILKYEVHTCVEYLKTHTDECKDFYNTELLNYKGATHIVAGIEWGAVVAVEFKDKVDNTVDRYKIAGDLAIEFKKLKGILLSVSPDANADIKLSEESKKSSFEISVRGDVSLPSQVPSTYQQVQELIQKVPELIKKTNQGKGVPVKFFLLPITALKKHLNFVNKENYFASKIQEGLLTAFVNIFDDISETEQNLNDAYEQIYKNKACVAESERSRIALLRDNFKISRINFSSQMRETLVKVRSGEPEILLSKICNEYKKHEFSPVKVRLELNTFRSVLSKVEMYQTIRRTYPEIMYFGLTNDLESALLRSIQDCVYVLYMNSKYNNTHSDVWARTRKAFYETLNRPFNRLFLVDCDFPFLTSASFPKDRSVIQQVVKGITTVHDVLDEIAHSTRSDSLTMKALGRQAKLGELYNARTDTFLEYSLLKDNYSESIVHSIEQNTAESTYVQTERFQDKCKALGLDLEQQFTVLSNLTPLTRSGKYLASDKQSNLLFYENPVKSFVHTLHLTEKNVKITDTKLWDNVEFEAMNKGATHFVLKIEYGFTSVFSVEELKLLKNKGKKLYLPMTSSVGNSSQQDEPLQHYTAGLKAIVDRYDSVTDGNDEVQFAHLNGNFTATVYSDIQGETSKPVVLRNKEDLRHFMNTKFIPSLTKNLASGVPIAYVLYPLSNLVLDVGMLCSCVLYGTLASEQINPAVLADIFYSINVGKAQIKQMTAHLKAHRNILTDADFEMFEKVKQDVNSTLGTYEAQFQKFVRDIKSGNANSVDLYSALVEKYQNSKFFDRNNKYIGLAQLGSIEEKIQFYERMKANSISFLGRESSESEIDAIIADDFDARIYFLHYSSVWTVEFKDLWVKTLAFFLGSLSKAKLDGIVRKLYVVGTEFGHSISKNVTRPVIQEFRKGTMSCDNVVSTAIAEEIKVQKQIKKLEDGIRNINTQVTGLDNKTDKFGKELNTFALSVEQKWETVFADYELTPSPLYAPHVEEEAKLNDLRWIRDLITKLSKTDLKNEAAKLSNWLLRLQEAENIFESDGSLKLLESQERILSELMDEEQLFSFADVLNSKAKYTEALSLYEKIFKRRVVSLGPDHYDTLSAQYRAAMCQCGLGEYSKALHLYKFVYHKWSQTLGPDHSNTLAAQHNVALMLHKEGKYADALRIYEQVLQKERRIFGENHKSTKLTKFNMANTRKHLGMT